MLRLSLDIDPLDERENWILRSLLSVLDQYELPDGRVKLTAVEVETECCAQAVCH